MSDKLDVRSIGWYSHYRHSVFNVVETSFLEGATRVVLFGIKPKFNNACTNAEYPALLEDLKAAYQKKVVPFFRVRGDTKQKVIDLEKIEDRRVTLDRLEMALRAELADESGCYVVIISCTDEAQEQVMQVIKKINQDARFKGRVKKAWATASDMFADPRATRTMPPAEVAAPPTVTSRPSSRPRPAAVPVRGDGLLPGSGWRARFEAEVDDFGEALLVAARDGNRAVVTKLVMAKANLEAKAKDQSRPLHLAAMNGHLEIVKHLVQAKANLEAENSHQSRPLHLAANHGDFWVVKHLVQARAQLNPRDTSGRTPLVFAEWEKEQDLAYFLLAHGSTR
mmetsp:Transcript_135345/g.432091  ORF Transcript_135345/g.432091 Transcript_135345/m.432091 type:complete len:338 (+) Transcript_135345:94-1107(+)